MSSEYELPDLLEGDGVPDLDSGLAGILEMSDWELPKTPDDPGNQPGTANINEGRVQDHSGDLRGNSNEKHFINFIKVMAEPPQDPDSALTTMQEVHHSHVDHMTAKFRDPTHNPESRLSPDPSWGGPLGLVTLDGACQWNAVSGQKEVVKGKPVLLSLPPCSKGSEGDFLRLTVKRRTKAGLKPVECPDGGAVVEVVPHPAFRVRDTRLNGFWTSTIEATAPWQSVTLRFRVCSSALGHPQAEHNWALEVRGLLAHTRMEDTLLPLQVFARLMPCDRLRRRTQQDNLALEDTASPAGGASSQKAALIERILAGERRKLNKLAVSSLHAVLNYKTIRPY